MTPPPTKKRIVCVVDDETGEIIYREANAAEIAQAELDAKAAIGEQRDRKQREIVDALAATDWWLIREAEGGQKMTAKQKAYRAALRNLHAKTETENAPAELALPDLPGGAA